MKEKTMKEMKSEPERAKDEKAPVSGRKVFFEITMYKLLAMVLIGFVLFLGLGLYFGHFIGKANAIDKISIETPAYCSYDKSLSSVQIKCNELSNTTATELCSMLSTPLRDRMRVLVVM